MPEFQCRVATPSGDVFERSYVADDEGGLRRDLETQDLMILDVRRQNPVLQAISGAVRLKSAVSMREFLLFNQEFSALIRAGLPIVASLDILLERRKNQTFKTALLDIRDRVKSGEALSDSFAAHGNMFPTLYASSLASGERSGELASVLGRYIDYMRRVLQIRAKVVSALIYPTILLTLSVALVAVMLFFVIPKFNEFLSGFGQELPLVTQIVMGTATFCKDHWQIILAIVVGAVVAGLVWNKTDRGRLFVDRAKLRVPLLGRIVDAYAQNRFTRTLATLQAGGIPLVTSLELSARAVGNTYVEQALLDVTEQVREGRALYESLADTGLMSDITIQMVKVGESTGALEEMLNNASDFTDHEIDTTLTRLVALFEPLMLVFMAIVVAVMLMSVYLPMIQVYGSAGF
jgi:type IV pilus assembly protein PilC